MVIAKFIERWTFQHCYLFLTFISNLDWFCIHCTNYNFQKFILFRSRDATTRKVCRILSVCIKKWRYTKFHIVLQGRTTITALKLYNNMCRVRTLCHLLQWTIKWSVISQRLCNLQWLYRALRGICNR